MGSLSSLLAALLLAVVAGAGAVEFNATDFIPDAAAGVGLNSSKAAVYWGPWTKARATWYGQPNGAGPDDNGGACGFKHTNQYPFASMTSCGNQPLFKDGKGCGSCYKMHQGPFLLREDGDGDHHRHELLPGGALPLRPQRHGVRQARQARPQRQAAPLRHHRHRVHQGAMRVPGAEDRVPRGRVLEPGVLRGAGGVRGRRRRRGAGGPHGVADGAWAADWAVDADEGVVGIHLEAGRQPPAAGAVLHPHPQRVRQDAGRQGGHPGQLEAQHLLPLHRPVQLNRPVLVAAAIIAAAAAAARSAITIAATT